MKNRVSSALPLAVSGLFETKYGKLLKGKIKFNSKQAWVRHDEHIHVDFAISCKKKKVKHSLLYSLFDSIVAPSTRIDFIGFPRTTRLYNLGLPLILSLLIC